MILKISTIEADLKWNDPQYNLEQISVLMDNAPKAEIYVLPEMFPTGFVTDPKIIDPMYSQEFILDWMRAEASKRDAAIVGSAAVKDGPAFYNRAFFVRPTDNSNAEVLFYDKHHLFNHGGEDEFYSAGTKRMIVEYKSFKILLLVCYDLRFPVWSRNKIVNEKTEEFEYDLLIYMASWPTPRINVWDILLRARAIENQCYVVGVNRVGQDPYNEYPGHSAIIDYKGNLIIEGELNLMQLQDFRRKFCTLKDGNNFSI